MKAILDTHIFLWWNLNDPRLSLTAREFIANGRNELFLSVASAWEIAIKTARGRLLLPEDPERYVTSSIMQHHIQPLLSSRKLRVNLISAMPSSS